MCIKKEELLENEEEFLIMTVDMCCHIKPEKYPCILVYHEEKSFGKPLIVDKIKYINTSSKRNGKKRYKTT